MTGLQKNLLLDVLNKHKQFGINYIDSIYFDKVVNASNQLPNTIPLLNEYVNNCNLCSLSKEKIDISFGDGAIDSKVYIVTTNKNDILDSNIYNMLKNMFEKVLMLDMDSLYLTYILKCVVTNKNNEQNKHVKVCIEYLKKQLSIKHPKVIITLGDAFNHLMENDENVVDVSGTIYTYNNAKVIPLIHPEFLYKNPSYKQKTLSDLNKIKIVLENL